MALETLFAEDIMLGNKSFEDVPDKKLNGVSLRKLVAEELAKNEMSDLVPPEYQSEP